MRLSWFAVMLVLAVGRPSRSPVAGQVPGGELGEVGPLVEAVLASRAEEVERLLGAGADPSPLALYAAVGLRDTSILEMLIAAGGDVNARAHIEDGDSMDLTPLFGAAMAGRLDMVNLLLEAGADPSVTNRFMGMEMTPLEIASMSKRTEVMTVLKNAGSSLAGSGPGAVASELALVTAIQDGDTSAVRVLLESGMNVNHRLNDWATPLGLAAGYPRGDLVRQETMVSVLIEAGADVNGRNADGATPFMLAARRGAPGMMTLLLDAGADPDARDEDGRHAITYADGYDPTTEVVTGASSDLRSLLPTPMVRDAGSYPPGSYTAPCGKSGAPPPSGIPLAKAGVTNETSTLIRGPDGSPAGVAPPECSAAALTAPGSYRGLTTTCSVEWSVNEYALRQTTGEGTNLAYIHEETSCSDEAFSFSIAPEPPTVGPEDRCREARLKLTIPAENEQFAFDDADTARVEIPLQAFAEPEDCAEEIVWEAPDIEGVEKIILSGGGGGGPGEARLVYTNLPESNDAFEPLTVRATLGGQSAEVEIQLFYDPEATNHPDGHPTISPLGHDGLPGDSVPNWYYYWSQTNAMFGQAQRMTYYTQTIPAVNNPGDDVAARYDFEDEVILISDRVYAAGCRGRVDPNSLASLGQRATGIDCFGEMLRHEYQHREEDVAWWRTGASDILYFGGFIRVIRSALEDKDGDRVPRDVEEAFGWGCTDERMRSCARLPFNDVTDNEINAYYVGWNQWPLSGLADDRDWSRCGKQWTSGGC